MIPQLIHFVIHTLHIPILWWIYFVTALTFTEKIAWREAICLLFLDLNDPFFFLLLNKYSRKYFHRQQVELRTCRALAVRPHPFPAFLPPRVSRNRNAYSSFLPTLTHFNKLIYNCAQSRNPGIITTKKTTGFCSFVYATNAEMYSTDVFAF